jgi:hypothetical protein
MTAPGHQNLYRVTSGYSGGSMSMGNAARILSVTAPPRSVHVVAPSTMAAVQAVQSAFAEAGGSDWSVHSVELLDDVVLVYAP